MVLAQADSDRIRELERRVSELEKLISARPAPAPTQAAPGSAPPATTQAATVPGPSYNLVAWKQLKRGMSKGDVRKLLGEPERVVATSIRELWFWDYPNGGDVTFDASSRVNGWDEPQKR